MCGKGGCGKLWVRNAVLHCSARLVEMARGLCVDGVIKWVVYGVGPTLFSKLLPINSCKCTFHCLDKLVNTISV